MTVLTVEELEQAHLARLEQIRNDAIAAHVAMWPCCKDASEAKGCPTICVQHEAWPELRSLIHDIRAPKYIDD
jgi:hypothetical protein